MSVEQRLRAATESGKLSSLADLYARRALLDSNLPGARQRVAGPEAIVAHLAESMPGAGRLVDWSAAAHAHGLALWLERVGDDGAVVRQRHYVHLESGRISRHWVYAARPHTPPPGSVEEQHAFDTSLIAQLGRVVRQELVRSGGWSGNRLERLVLDDGRRLVAKRVVPGANWLDRHSRNEGREALLFRDGVLDRVATAFDHAVVAIARDGDAWWVVMRDVSSELLDVDSPITREQNRRILSAANTMWEEFWGEQVPHTATMYDRLRMTSKAIAAIERDGVDLLPKQLEVCWESLAQVVADDVADAVLRLVEDPSPLCAELDRCGRTLVHADLRDEHLGFADDGRVVLVDWGAAALGHPVVDLAWYMVHDVWRIDARHDEIVADFRHVRGEHDDPQALELLGIVGLVMYGWILGHSAVVHTDPAEREWALAELDWWVPRARRGLERWSPA